MLLLELLFSFVDDNVGDLRVLFLECGVFGGVDGEFVVLFVFDGFLEEKASIITSSNQETKTAPMIATTPIATGNPIKTAFMVLISLDKTHVLGSQLTGQGRT